MSSDKTHQRRDTYFGPLVQYTSTMVVNLQQFQTDLHEQHQYEKHALTELNQRFHLFIDQIQSLQTQNIEYCQAIERFRRQFSIVDTSDIDKNYFSLKSNYFSISNEQIDFEWNLKLFQLQTDIYKQLIQIQDQSRNKKILSLEEELKQSKSLLINLRTSYEQLQKNIDHIHIENQKLTDQYFLLTKNCCHMKKQQKKTSHHIEWLKNSIVFYKHIQTNSGSSNSLIISSEDGKQFWQKALNEIMKKIRSDFEIYYRNNHQQMIEYYEMKTKELDVDIQNTLHYQQIQIEEEQKNYRLQMIEYEKIQKSLMYEKEIFNQLELTCSKLEGEYQSIQSQYEQQFEIQSNDFEQIREDILTINYDIEQTRRNKTNLELEILIYRQLLQDHTPIVSQVQSNRNEITEQMISKRPIRLNCASDGTYISLVNTSKNKTIDLSQWILTQDIDRRKHIRFIIPNGIQLIPNGELKIYSKSANNNAIRSSSNKKLIIVNKNIVLWGIGNTIDTCLFNQNNIEEAIVHA